MKKIVQSLFLLLYSRTWLRKQGFQKLYAETFHFQPRCLELYANIFLTNEIVQLLGGGREHIVRKSEKITGLVTDGTRKSEMTISFRCWNYCDWLINIYARTLKIYTKIPECIVEKLFQADFWIFSSKNFYKGLKLNFPKFSEILTLNPYKKFLKQKFKNPLKLSFRRYI